MLSLDKVRNKISETFWICMDIHTFKQWYWKCCKFLFFHGDNEKKNWMLHNQVISYYSKWEYRGFLKILNETFNIMCFSCVVGT